jgi:D-alanine-D-alanine ligase
MVKMIKVFIITGGNSAERAVSLKSTQAVALNLKKAGFLVTIIDALKPFNNYLSEIRQCDVVFPLIHGKGGEDGKLQKFLENLNVKFIGSDSLSSRLCFNKDAYLKLLNKHDFLIPPTELVTFDEFQQSQLILKPFVVKPINEGSSVDTVIVKHLDQDYLKEVKPVFLKHKHLLLESFIDGQEITVACFNEQALPVIEIIPPPSESFDYKNKYNGKTKELCPPKNISMTLQDQAKDLAQRIHQLCNCRDISRTDMIIQGEQIYVLETNTIPGLSNQSLLPKAVISYGLSLPDFYSQLVNNALKR